ncbi:MAG: hypothetical protein U0892_21575, partial [Pirellulales bacterium]
TNVSNTGGGDVTVHANGLITATSVSATGAGADVTLATTTGGITATSVSAADNVTLTADAGDIAATSVTGTNGFVSITATNGSVLLGNVTAGTTVTAQASGTNSDIVVNQTTQAAGAINLTAADQVRFAAAGVVKATAAGDITITADSDAAAGNDGDSIFMASGSSIQANTGAVKLVNNTATGGDVTLSSVQTNSAAANAIEIRSGKNIVDGTATETALLSATAGTIVLTANNGAIGSGAAANDIDIDSINLVFNAAATAAGIVQITDLAGGVKVSGTSSAGGGGFLTANSPLTISADVNVGSDMTFTAGNSNAAGDNLTIDANAKVTLSSGANHTLTFNAGDDIYFNTGSVVTTGGGVHTVNLNADLEGAGVADGQRGAIKTTAGPIEAVRTNNLFASAGSGIALSTKVDKITASTTTVGVISILETDAVELTSITTNDGSITVQAGGNMSVVNVDSSNTDSDVNDIQLKTTAGDITLQTVKAGSVDGDVDINAFGSIMDGDTVPDDVDVTGDNITLTAGQNIGGTTGDIFHAVVNPIEVVSSGDINATANALTGLIALDATAAGTINLSAATAWVQSNGDINAAPTYSVKNLALIADADHNGTGTLALGNSLSVVGDMRLEGADITAADGSIDLSADRLMVKSGQGETLNVTVNQLDVTTGDSANIHTTGSVELIDLEGDNVAVQSLNSTGNISITASGNILVTDDVIAGNDGTSTSFAGIALFATGANSSVTINDLILSDNGPIIVFGNKDVIFGTTKSVNDQLNDDLRVITTINGNIDISTSTGSVTMEDGSKIIAGRNPTAYDPGTNGNPSPSTITLGTVDKPIAQAEINVLSTGNATISSLQTMNVGLRAIRVTSTNGEIIDAGDAAGDTNLVANRPGALTTLTASQGIGISGAGAVETALYALDVRNGVGGGGAGDIRITETAAGGGLNLVYAENAAPTGDVQIRTTAGNLNIPSPAFAPNNGAHGVITAAGNILLQAGSGSLFVDSQVGSNSGHITLDADNAISTTAAVQTFNTGTIPDRCRHRRDD